MILSRDIRKSVRFSKNELQEIAKLKFFMRMNNLSDVIRNSCLQVLRIYQDDRARKIMQDNKLFTLYDLVCFLIDNQDE